MHNIIEKDKPLEEIIAESGKLLTQLQDKEFRKQIKSLLKLKAILDNESILNEKQRDSFYALFQSLSPLDRLQKQISVLTTANQQTLRSQVSSTSLYQATDISFAASSTLSKLWNCYNELITHKIDKGFSKLVTRKQRGLKARLLYAEIMTRQALEEGRPTREFIEELPVESRQKLTTLVASVDEAVMVKELQELGQYLYQITPKEQLVKDTPEIKNINIQVVDYIIKKVELQTSFVEKAKAIEFWLNVMQSSKKQYNFYGAQIIRTAFMDNKLYKLIRKPEVWKFISPVNQEILQELEKYSIHRDTKDVEELLTTSSAKNKTIIPSIAGIKILAESLKGRSVNNESNAPESASTILHKQRIQRLLDVAYENLPEKSLQPSFLQHLSREEKLVEGTVGEILLQQLTSKDSRQGFQSLLSIIQKTSLENQIAFIESYNELFSKNLNLSALKKTFAEYAKETETIQALQNQWVESKKNIYEAIDSHKAALKTAKNAKARKSIKKEIRKLDDQLKTINKNFKSQVSNNKKLFDQSKKPAVIEALQATFLKVQESFVQLSPDAEGHATRIRKWIEPALKSPTGYIGDLFNAPMVQITENNPSLLGLHHAFENNTKISDCLYVSGKMGGANDPGRYGGNYLRCFQTADGQIHTQLIFFKQATDHGLANHRENMAEVLAGHIMNGLSENLAASIILAKPHDLPSKDTMANPDEAYVGSLFLHEFTDIHKKSHQMLGQPAGKRGKGAYGGQNINNPVLGNPHFQTGFNRLVQEEKLDVANLAKGIMSSLLVGNYQIHTENVGIAKVGAKKEFVILDFGGAFRRLFKKKGAFKTQEQSGQFPKAVLPYLTKGRKYDACYLLAFPQEIRESKEFIQGIEAVADFDPEKLFKILEKAIDYTIQYYGEKTFIKDFCSKLDTTQQELDVSSGTDQQKIQKTKQFLYFRLLSRQLSLKNFALNLKLKNPAFDTKVILADNPVYSKYQSLSRNEKFVQIITEAKALLSWLTEQNLPELKSLENFLDYALSGDNYDLAQKDDQDILIQTMNEVHQKIRQYYPNLLEQIPVLVISDAPQKNLLTMAHEDTRQEIKSAEHKVADGIKQLYHLAQEKLREEKINYDAQGIASVHFSKEQLPQEIREKFPNALNKGVTIHLFKAGFVRVPPINHILQIKTRSLCDAARHLYKIEIAYSGLTAEKLTQLIESAAGDLKLLNNLVKNELQTTIGDVLNQLFEKYCSQYKVEHTQNNFTTFTQSILQESAHHRADVGSILTFNQDSQHFSFDEGASIASHNRNLGVPVANMSWIFDGHFDEKHNQFSVTSSFVKHASIAPLKLTKGASSVDGWIDTYSKAIEVIKHMALIRQFGRSAQEADQPMQLDFNYLLFTTLAGNQQKQLQSYLHIKRALQALDGVQLTFDLGARNPTKVIVNASVMNTGINVLQKFRAFSKAKQTVARENRKSYQRLTQAVRDYPLSIEIKDQTFQKMVNYLRFNVQASLSEETEMNTDQLARSQEKLAQLNESLREKWHLYKKTQPGSEERKVMQELLTDLRQHIKTENQILDKIWNKPLEEIQKRAWSNQKAKTAEALAYLQSSAGKQQIEKLTSDELQSLNVYILKAKMDDLYFSGQYLEPKSAAVFNTYFLIAERISGIMSSAGCKSANDRTAIIRVMTALLSENPQAELSQLLAQMSTDWMSNGSMFSCISDTAGGTPKVYNDRQLEGTNNFSFLAGVELTNSADFGKFASHKLLKHPEKLTAAPVSAKKPDAVSASRLGLFSRGAVTSKRSSLSLSIEALCQRIENQNVQESQKEFRYYKKDELANVIYRLAADQQQISGFLRQENLTDNDRERLTQTLQKLGKVLSERTEMRDTLTMVD